MTTTIKKQTRKFTKTLSDGSVIVATVRHDDNCNNGHNSFSITGDLYDRTRNNGDGSVKNDQGKTRWLGSCGCIHDDIRRAFPELRHLIRWHLSSTDGPMHYVANALYWLGDCNEQWKDGKPNSPPNLEHFKSTVCFGVVPEFDNIDPAALMGQPRKDVTRWLESRLERLLEEFRNDVEAFGFDW